MVGVHSQLRSEGDMGMGFLAIVACDGAASIDWEWSKDGALSADRGVARNGCNLASSQEPTQSFNTCVDAVLVAFTFDGVVLPVAEFSAVVDLLWTLMNRDAVGNMAPVNAPAVLLSALLLLPW